MCRCDAISWSLGKELTTVRWAGGTILISLLPWHTHTCTHTHTHTHVRIHTHLHSHTHAHTHTYTHTYTHTLTHTYTHTYTHSHSHTHTHTHTHIHTLTHTHTHTHTVVHTDIPRIPNTHSTHTQHTLTNITYQLHYSTVQSVSVCTCMCVWNVRVTYIQYSCTLKVLSYQVCDVVSLGDKTDSCNTVSTTSV